jgi:hypothetical protein
MYAMAINTNRDFRVALCEKLSVNASLVLAQLIGPQGRVVLAHESRIGVAAAAEFRDLTPHNLAAKSGSLAHGIHICSGGITAMAARARQPFLRVDVAGELLLGYLKRGIERAVAIEAGVLRLRGNCAGTCTQHE